MKQVGVVVAKVSHKNKKDFFKMFGLDISFDIDKDYLSKKYSDLSTQFHPDKYQSNIEKELATKKFIDIQNAYKCLKDDMLRIEHIFLLNNIDHTSNNHITTTMLEEQLCYQERYMKLGMEGHQTQEIESIKTEYLNNFIKLKNLLDKKDFQGSLKYYFKYRFLKKLLNT